MCLNSGGNDNEQIFWKKLEGGNDIGYYGN